MEADEGSRGPAGKAQRAPGPLLAIRTPSHVTSCAASLQHCPAGGAHPTEGTPMPTDAEAPDANEQGEPSPFAACPPPR
jgi:hypothetical protein